MSEEITRSLTSASNLRQRELCPGSAFAEQGLPNTDNDDSKEGTLLHAADADRENQPYDLTPEQREVLSAAQAADEQIFRAVAEKYQIAADEVFIEGREDERWLRRGFKTLFPGHPDRWRFYTDRGILIVIDKKFGRREVTPADSNIQLRAYGIMVAEEFDPERTIVAINQPRLPSMLRVTMGEYTRDNLADAKQHVYRIWDGSHNKDGSPREDVPRIAGEEQCHYCKAKEICDAYREKFVFLEKPAANGKDLFVGRLADLTDEELDRVYVATRFAKLIEDNTKEEILKRISRGEMQNYSATPSGFTSSITDNAKALELLQATGLEKAEIIRPVTMEELEKAYIKRFGGTLKAAKDAIKSALAPVMESKPKSPTLKRAKNPTNLPQLQ
jgi:hypothetical protein